MRSRPHIIFQKLNHNVIMLELTAQAIGPGICDLAIKLHRKIADGRMYTTRVTLCEKDPLSVTNANRYECDLLSQSCQRSCMELH